MGQDQDVTFKTDAKTRTLTFKTKAKTKTLKSKTKSKTKALKNLPRGASRQGTASRHHITAERKDETGSTMYYDGD